VTGLERLVPDRRTRVDWLGVEHEYVVDGPDGAVDFRSMVGQHPHGLAGLHPDDGRARWLPDGALLTADGREAEVATAPVPVGPGCSLDVLARCDAAYSVLRDGLADDLALMGRNLMRRKGRHDVIVTARRTVAEQLRSAGVAELVRDLPPGEPHKIAKPAGDPSTWPAIGPSARAA